jgi:hypothetical protein
METDMRAVLPVLRPVSAAAAVAILTVTPSLAGSVSSAQVASDAAMNDMINEKFWVAEGRFGNNNANNGDWEMGIWSPTTVTDQAGFNWASGRELDFTLTYLAGPQQVRLTIIDSDALFQQTVTSFEEPGFDTLFLRTRATKAGSSILLDNLELNGQAINDTSFASGDGDGLGILKLGLDGMDQGLSLVGTMTMTWGQVTPRGSHLAFQIKATDSDMVVVPTPTAAAGGLLGLAGLAWRRRRIG